MVKKRSLWVKHVQETSNAMSLPEGIFTKNLSEQDRARLEQAKIELRQLFGKE